MCTIIGDVCCALGSLSSLLHGWMRTCSCWAEGPHEQMPRLVIRADHTLQWAEHHGWAFAGPESCKTAYFRLYKVQNLLQSVYKRIIQ